MINLSLTPTKSLSYTIIWVLFVIPSCILSVDERHRRCALGFSCGTQTLNYPFRKPDEEECGHPDFKVNCSRVFAEFNISSVKFRILEVNYYETVTTLARMDYLNNLCPHKPENATINQQVLPFHEDTELGTFYYNCSGPRVVDLLPHGSITQLECLGGPSYFVSSPSDSGNIAIFDGLRASCERIVNIPVSRSAMKTTERNQSLDAIKKALDEGFKLNFNWNYPTITPLIPKLELGRSSTPTKLLISSFPQT